MKLLKDFSLVANVKNSLDFCWPLYGAATTPKFLNVQDVSLAKPCLYNILENLNNIFIFFAFVL